MHPLAVCLVCMGLACAPPAPEGDEESVPRITGVSTYALSVGEPFEVYGTGFVAPDIGVTEVHFVGTFRPTGLRTTSAAVNLPVALEARGPGSLLWEQFGDYQVPFGTGTQIGTFSGEIVAANVYYDDAAPGGVRREWQATPPLPLTLEVKPSLVVAENRAFGEDFVADCNTPSTVVLEELRYGLSVRAVGFVPNTFGFVTGPGLLVADADAERWHVERYYREHAYAAEGNREFAIAHRWAPVPRFSLGYAAEIVVRARNDRESHSLRYPMIVRPAAMPVTTRPPTIGVEAAQQVSACIPGIGAWTTYADATSETRAREMSHVVDGDSLRGVDVLHRNVSARARHGFGPSEVVLADLTFASPTALQSSRMFSREPGVSRTSSLVWRQDHDQLLRSERMEKETTAASGEGAGAVPDSAIGLGFHDRWPLLAMLGVWSTVLPTRGVADATGRPAEATWGFPRSYANQVGAPFWRAHAGFPSQAEARAVGEVTATVLAEAAPVPEQASSTAVLDLQPRHRYPVWAGNFGMWYRQAARVRTEGALVVHDLCGNGTVVGQSQLDDWDWRVQLQTDAECPPPPPENLFELE